jgi:hypothetical protein
MAVERKLRSLDEILSSGLFVAELLASSSREGRSLADADAKQLGFSVWPATRHAPR